MTLHNFTPYVLLWLMHTNRQKLNPINNFDNSQVIYVVTVHFQLLGCKDFMFLNRFYITDLFGVFWTAGQTKSYLKCITRQREKTVK